MDRLRSVTPEALYVSDGSGPRWRAVGPEAVTECTYRTTQWPWGAPVLLLKTPGGTVGLRIREPLYEDAVAWLVRHTSHRPDGQMHHVVWTLILRRPFRQFLRGPVDDLFPSTDGKSAPRVAEAEAGAATDNAQVLPAPEELESGDGRRRTRPADAPAPVRAVAGAARQGAFFWGCAGVGMAAIAPLFADAAPLPVDVALSHFFTWLIRSQLTTLGLACLAVGVATYTASRSVLRRRRWAHSFLLTGAIAGMLALVAFGVLFLCWVASMYEAGELSLLNLALGAACLLGAVTIPLIRLHVVALCLRSRSAREALAEANMEPGPLQ